MNPIEEDNTNEFGLDSENNYKEFLKIDGSMRPATSTQTNHLPYSRNTPPTSATTKSVQVNKQSAACTNKIIYHPYNKNRTSNSTNTNCTPQQIQNSPHQPTPSSTFQSAVTTTHFEESVMAIMKATLREVKLFRSEFKQHTNSCTCQATFEGDRTTLDLPVDSVEAFTKLESDVKTETQTQVYLIKHFKTINDQGMEKFVRRCLKSIITDKAASQFSWHGQQGNIAVKSYSIMALLKDEAVNKFNPRVADIETIIKKWFQYAKDRHRRIPLQ